MACKGPSGRDVGASVGPSETSFMAYKELSGKVIMLSVGPLGKAVIISVGLPGRAIMTNVGLPKRAVTALEEPSNRVIVVRTVLVRDLFH